MSALITRVEHAHAKASDTVKVAQFVETSVIPVAEERAGQFLHHRGRDGARQPLGGQHRASRIRGVVINNVSRSLLPGGTKMKQGLLAFFAAAALAFAQQRPLDNIVSRQYQQEVRPLRLALDGPLRHHTGGR
jgi:hypothetical protein